MLFNEIFLSLVFHIIDLSALICLGKFTGTCSREPDGGRTFFGPAFLGARKFLTPENEGRRAAFFYSEKCKFSKEKRGLSVLFPMSNFAGRDFFEFLSSGLGGHFFKAGTGAGAKTVFGQ